MNNLAAQLVGLAATVLGICSLHFKTPRGLILCQTAGNLAFTVHYLMLGAYSASVGQILTILNAFVILWAKATGSQRKGWKWGFTILSLIACLASWKDNFSIFPCIGTVVIVLANWTFDSQIIRFNKLRITCPGWVISHPFCCYHRREPGHGQHYTSHRAPAVHRLPPHRRSAEQGDEAHADHALRRMASHAADHLCASDFPFPAQPVWLRVNKMAVKAVHICSVRQV